MPPEQSRQEIDPKYISVLAAERRGKDLKNKQIIPTTLPSTVTKTTTTTKHYNKSREEEYRGVNWSYLWLAASSNNDGVFLYIYIFEAGRMSKP